MSQAARNRFGSIRWELPISFQAEGGCEVKERASLARKGGRGKARLVLVLERERVKLHFHVRVLSFEWLYCRRLPICPNKCKHKSKHNSKHDFYTIIQNMMETFKESFSSFPVLLAVCGQVLEWPLSVRGWNVVRLWGEWQGWAILKSFCHVA